MEPELGQLGAALSLTEEEESGVVFPTGLWHAEPLTSGFFVVGRLLSTKSFHPEALHNTLKLAFNPCELQLKDGFQDPGDNPPYGHWLRAAAPLSYRGRNGGALARDAQASSRRPRFVSQSVLQSQPPQPTPRRGSTIFGSFEPPTSSTKSTPLPSIPATSAPVSPVPPAPGSSPALPPPPPTQAYY
ncbi:hypothetical protein Salat_0657500 [Sesamum alatum]|uniref:Uncharacterized protein n=1 Tax=Sesamum alatum TaxID=300844 RepID=A0AAE2CUG7_9LAMI|nr:hypothetical protein Salat_0657500 [Sesamum alatum]